MEDVYMVQPPSFIDKTRPHYVCKLRQALYGLKQAPQAWYIKLKHYLLSIGFVNTISDSSLFILRHSHDLIYLLVYIDDIIVTGSDSAFIDAFIKKISASFSLKDLGSLSYFLSVEVIPHLQGLFLSQ